eukprot:m.340495 g.340495  ORF g.340495 m.340495 type:complete len:87 (+) comp19329_c0_seq1:1445-1705(+)
MTCIITLALELNKHTGIEGNECMLMIELGVCNLNFTLSWRQRCFEYPPSIYFLLLVFIFKFLLVHASNSDGATSSFCGGLHSNNVL